MRRTLSFLFALTLVFVSVATMRAQGLHAKIEARKAEAERPRDVKGATELKITRSYQASFDEVLNWMKKSEMSIDFPNTDKDKGILATTIEQLKGGFSKGGERLVVTLIRASDTETTLRVAAVNYSKLGADNWSQKDVNPDDTKKFVDDLQALFKMQK